MTVLCCQLISITATRIMSSLSNMPRGFTLVEMAIVLLIMALLLGGGLSMLSVQSDQQRIKDTNLMLNDAREALIGYAASHVDGAGKPYLPCPDKTGGGGAGTANDGQEDRAVGGACVVQQGNFPWVTLGMAQADPWGNRLRYSVTNTFSNSTAGFTLASTGGITINDAAGTALASTIPAVLISHGKNGSGAINSSGTANAAPAGANELTNTNPLATAVSNPPVGVGGGGGVFDDLVVWLPPTTLFNRMIQAGRLP
jgi:prepilin-type N-terminal cleavage/methylation domain-containing protein